MMELKIDAHAVFCRLSTDSQGHLTGIEDHMQFVALMHRGTMASPTSLESVDDGDEEDRASHSLAESEHILTRIYSDVHQLKAFKDVRSPNLDNRPP